jgi:oligosaccharide repeat unit polymerase
MFEISAAANYLPLEYWLCAILIATSCALAIRQRQELWVAPYLAVLGTVAGWYMVEPLYFEEFLGGFSDTSIAAAFRCLLVFLVALIISAPIVTRLFQPGRKATRADLISISPEHLVPIIVGTWIVLLLFGIYRMEGDVFATLFPLEGRTNSTMWQRAAGEDAGATGFIVSTAAYLYVLVLSMFGLLLPITKKQSVRWVLILCIIISWPYALLQGSRNITLAVITPMIAAYLLLGRRSPLIKVVVAVVAFLSVDMLMRLIIEYRDVGFESTSLRDIETARHSGLNMASELVYINELLSRNIMQLTFGKGYLDELLNVVPRAIWPGKPYIGIDYAIARGFAGGDADIGVFATLSTGIVGQGVLEFGAWLGPIVAAILMSTWIGILARLRAQGGAARVGLFLVGLGLTFNLGRGLTLLTLYPFLFGYIGLVILEKRALRKQREAEEMMRRVASANTALARRRGFEA